MSTLIKNGRIITADMDYVADIYIEKEQVTLIGENLKNEADKIIDAKGKYVIPGGIDVHTHLDMPFGGTTSRVAAEATAFGERSMGWMYSLDGVWTDPADDTANIEWSQDGWTSAERFGHLGRAYLNFPGHGEVGAALTRATFGPKNYQRLVEIKIKYVILQIGFALTRTPYLSNKAWDCQFSTCVNYRAIPRS